MSSSKKSKADEHSTTMAVNKSLLSVDYASAYHHVTCSFPLIFFVENQEISDYLKEGDVGFKKPKASVFNFVLHAI
jgi:hypothetical protein